MRFKSKNARSGKGLQCFDGRLTDIGAHVEDGSYRDSPIPGEPIDIEKRIDAKSQKRSLPENVIELLQDIAQSTPNPYFRSKSPRRPHRLLLESPITQLT